MTAIAKTSKKFRKPLAIGTTVVLVGLAVVIFLRTGIAPPEPSDLAVLDPEVAELIEKRINSVKSNTRNLARREQLGRAYEANEFYRLAAETYQQILDQQPTNGRVWFRNAVCLERIDLDVAIESMQHCIELEPNFAPARWRQAIWLCDVGRFEEAQTRVDEALQIDPDDKQAQLVRAKILVALQQNEKAIDYIEQNRLRQHSNPEYAMLLLGSAYRQMGNLVQAARLLEQIDEPRPFWRDEWTNEIQQDKVGLPRLRVAAAHLFKQGRYAEAIEQLNEVIRRGDREFRSWNIIGAAQLQLGQLDEGIAAFQQAAKLDPRHFGSNLNCALAMLTGIGQRDINLEQAFDYADAAVDIRPHSAPARSVRAHLYEANNELEPAFIDFMKASELDPGNSEYDAYAGLVEIRLGQWEAAQCRFERLKGSYTNSPQVNLGLAAIAACEGRAEEARKLMRKISKSQLADPLSVSIMEQMKF